MKFRRRTTLFARGALALAAAVFIGQALIGQTAPDSATAAQRCLVQGRITDAITGERVKEAKVQLHLRAPNPNPPGYSTISGPDGTYKFEKIVCGYYNLTVSNTGYADSAYRATLAEPTGDVIRVTHPGQQLANIDVALTPLGVVTGTVFDQEGLPVEKASVAVVGSVWYRGVLRHTIQNGARTDGLGQFRIGNVRPGKYHLIALRVGALPPTAITAAPGKPDIRPVRTYYPSALTLDTATPFTIKNGQQITNMDIHLRSAATYHIRGQVSNVAPESAGEHLAIGLVRREEQSAIFLPEVVTVNKDHTFDFPGLSPGSYTLCVLPTGPLNALARQDVEVANADVNNVQLVLSPASVQGHVTIENAAEAGLPPIDVKSVGISLQGAEPIVRAGYIRTSTRDDGTFAFENLAPAKYALLIGGFGKVYVKSVQFENQEILGQELDLTHGGGQLNVKLRYGGADLRGTVPEAWNRVKAQPGVPLDVSIALVADTAPEDPFGIRISPVAIRGAVFGMANIPPGHYRVYAIEKLDSTQLQNPNVLNALQRYGTEINFVENDKKQIQLPLITADQMQQVYTQSGMNSQ